ncbi:MAG: hypothetical protein ACE5GH_00945 [Fidelibacterota bacterium]
MANLEDTSVAPHDTFTTEIVFKTYQIPPSLGSHPTLYVGKKNFYMAPFSLLRLASLRPLRDSIETADSAYFELTVDPSESDTSLALPQFALGYFSLDSNYSEAGSNYSNVDWIPDSYPLLTSVTKEDTSTGGHHVRFYVDTSLVSAWMDTLSPEPLFILESAEEPLTSLTAFRSRESGSNRPFLKLFYHPKADTLADSLAAARDTAISVVSDLPIVIPPGLDGSLFDSLRSYVGQGAGLVTLMRVDLERLGIPREGVIVKARLILNVDGEESDISVSSQFEVQAYSLSDTVDNWQWGEILEKDRYEHGVIGALVSGRETIKSGEISLGVKSLLQSLVSGIMENYGFKLLTTSSASIFDYAAFQTVTGDSLTPRLEVLYEAP